MRSCVCKRASCCCEQWSCRAQARLRLHQSAKAAVVAVAIRAAVCFGTDYNMSHINNNTKSEIRAKIKVLHRELLRVWTIGNTINGWKENELHL